MAKLIVLGGLIYGGYWLYKYILAHPNIDKGNVIKTVGVIIVGLIALTKKNNTNSPKIIRTYRCRGCGREIQETRISSSDIIGDSIYFGKRASDISVVVYDKKLETKTQDIWFRTELRFRHDWANRVIATLVENSSEFSSYISSILKRNLQFRSHTENYSEVRRRNLATWYERYLEYICQQELHCGKMKFLAS
ncbi:replication initiation factor domain-containing protein [Enterococcus faecium]|uniref:replication initiation factor domain-containing protein n=1 Tax=Enterococcus faecium TaxID=1352 RepID=UPI001E09F79E|nr:replication initiation factor domain-containing protein [Enterococcus faecium]MBK4836759.1 replication initiation protein [Enterococcus faecium]MBK4853185.1 replication initiation protein [Enterococcus faecium]MBK4864047.1 replication initiation protein [Enterococcus faecium]MBK4876785.1 replication initiation protein [Enterococcus faecium]